HLAGKRSYRKESAVAGADDGEGAHSPPAAGPTPQELLAVSEELERLIASLPERNREILHQRLQGESIPDIAARVGRSERTIRRILNACREELEERFRQIDQG